MKRMAAIIALAITVAVLTWLMADSWVASAIDFYTSAPVANVCPAPAAVAASGVEPVTEPPDDQAPAEPVHWVITVQEIGEPAGATVPDEVFVKPAQVIPDLPTP